jgi:hypothetical protein
LDYVKQAIVEMEQNKAMVTEKDFEETVTKEQILDHYLSFFEYIFKHVESINIKQFVKNYVPVYKMVVQYLLFHINKGGYAYKEDQFDVSLKLTQRVVNWLQYVSS